jgi:hypothetical protein
MALIVSRLLIFHPARLWFPSFPMLGGGSFPLEAKINFKI